MYPVTKPYFDGKELTLISEAISSGWVAQGNRVEEFEKLVAKHEGVKHAVATSSCTTALHLAMVAKGLGSGMDAIFPSFTFVATANAIVMSGATPIAVDVDEQTFNICVDEVDRLIKRNYTIKNGKLINRLSGNVLWGIIPVHQFGLCCEIREINSIAQKYGLNVIEDAACALGSMDGGVHEGAFGNVSCLSFHPRKAITTGEGGMILTDDNKLASRLRQLRSHGCSVSAKDRDKTAGFLLPEFNETGFNYRMTDIQGAMGIAQMSLLDSILERRRQLATKYTEYIKQIIPEFIPPCEPIEKYHTYQSYACRLDRGRLGIESVEEAGKYRNSLLLRLDRNGVSTRQGTHAVHMLGYYINRMGYIPEDYPHAYACDRLSISLPLYYELTEDDVKNIVDIIRNCIDEEINGL